MTSNTLKCTHAAAAKIQEKESVTIALKALNIIISAAEKAKIKIKKTKLNIERVKLEIEKKKVVTEKKKIIIKKIKLDIETIKLEVHCKLLRMIMYKTIKYVQRLTDYLDKNSVTVSNSSSSNEKFNNSDNSLFISLTDISTTAVNSFFSFFFNLSTPVDSLAMSSIKTLDILSEKFGDGVGDWHGGITITRSYNKPTFFRNE
ncbi:uncharacterized protein BDCG_16665 [Blastomyces dermatitidis ER-3]|uniref:Uncharacterized protein n=1 Tax=Ajellomyces dermatitidis (strain ER-3 / ATCC MYA-2586) TaxID=559297 RepID=A0ABX2VTM7_AJEDR|nr:uncharacterized protein BDCG_16665 [Blastomyces dermatitidis ER-3]OAT00545.1 hypothetical protein BDCG_16665 [Blastomyces dermatitidis ER-3]